MIVETSYDQRTKRVTRYLTIMLYVDNVGIRSLLYTQHKAKNEKIAIVCNFQSKVL